MSQYMPQSDQPLIINVQANDREEAIGMARGAAEQWFGHDQFTLSMLPRPETSEWQTVSPLRGKTRLLGVQFSATFEAAPMEVPL